MSNIDSQRFPRFALIAAAILIAGSITAAAAARYANLNDQPAKTSASMQPSMSVDLTFLDMDDGSVQVRDAAGESILYVAAPGTNGFIRGVMRGMARDRRARGIGQQPAFRLAQWPDGRLSLEDLATGRQIELSSFGASNRAAFAQLLDPAAGRAL